MRKASLLVPLLLLIIELLIFDGIKTRSSQKVENVHLHAGFQVYVDDKLMDFSDLKYMHIEPCGDDDHEEDEQIEKAHLHDGVGDVVHVHHANALWQDLFKNIDVSIPVSAEAYRNGEKTTDFLSQPINAYESIVIFIGKTTNIEKKLEDRVERAYMEEVEKRSENCGTGDN